MKQKTSVLKKYLMRPLYAIVGLLLLAMIFVQVFFPLGFVNIFGFQFYTISYTGSMEPTLNYNDLILIQKYDFDSLKEGDIITFVSKTRDGTPIIVTHAVHAVYEKPDTGIRYLQTKGDNLSLPDSLPVTENGIDNTGDYIGKYVGKSEFLGNFIAFCQSTYGIRALAINLLSLTCIYMILRQKQTDIRL